MLLCRSPGGYLPLATLSPAPAAERPDPAGQPDAALSDAMTAVTRAFTADLNDVPPDERWKEMARIMALTKEAADMVSAAAEAA